MSNRRFIVIQGPTASGKSGLAEQLAMEMNGEIISADSRQVYKYLDIGTAKPDKKVRKTIKYHLIDIVEPDEEYNAGLFAKDARKLVNDIFDRGKLPLITGGTGFYISAFLQGLAKVPPVTKETKAKVKRLFNKSPEKAYKYLQKVDPEAASKIETNDQHRQQRALEVYESSGRPLSWFWREQTELENRDSYLNILLQLPRKELYERINSRIEKMLSKGLIDEIRELLAMGFKEDDPGMISVGYREFYPWLRGEIPYNSAVESAKQHTRNYAKRQITWYRKQDFDLTIAINDLNLSLLKEKIKKFLIEGE